MWLSSIGARARPLVTAAFAAAAVIAGASTAHSQQVVAIVNGTLAAALGIGLRLWVAGLLLWFVGHMAAVWAAKRDPDFVEVVRRHVRIPGHLNT